MTDILEFIEARLAEDEQRARAAQKFTNRTSWRFVPDPHGGHHWAGSIEDEADDIGVSPNEIAAGVGEENWGRFIADNDPAAALRRCAGARDIIAAEMVNLSSLDGEFGGGCSADDIRAGKCDDRFGDLNRSNVLRGLASFWSHHPAYREEWAQVVSWHPSQEGEQGGEQP